MLEIAPLVIPVALCVSGHIIVHYTCVLAEQVHTAELWNTTYVLAALQVLISRFLRPETTICLRDAVVTGSGNFDHQQLCNLHQCHTAYGTAYGWPGKMLRTQLPTPLPSLVPESLPLQLLKG